MPVGFEARILFDPQASFYDIFQVLAELKKLMGGNSVTHACSNSIHFTFSNHSMDLWP